MFTAALSTIAKLWKEPKCQSTDEWIKKMWFIYIMEYYLAMRKNEIWPFAETWVEHMFNSYVDLEKLNRRPWGRGRGKKSYRGGRRQIIRDSWILRTN